MNTTINDKKTFKQKLLSLKNEQFTGRLDVTTDKGRQWRLYFCLSKLVWADGGEHPYRVWQRLLKQYCPELDQDLIDLEKAKQFECWNYHILIMLLERSQITKTEAIKLIQARILEALFDIFQAETEGNLDCKITTVSTRFLWELGLKVSVILLTIDNALNQVELEWLEWQKKGLINISPNKAPLIKNREFLAKHFTDKTYQKLLILFDGKTPLRELANTLDRDILKLLLWLKTYVDQGFIELLEVSDILTENDSIDWEDISIATNANNVPKLIACIDDSLQICQIMEHIVVKSGYKFMAVQDPIKALHYLIKYKPDLIFLDLIMPVVNGYEICSQIKRVSQLKDVPVIILTGNDGVIDRIRSKMVGSSGFLSKPINEEKVIKKINHFFSVKNSQSSNNSKSNDIKLAPQTVV